MFYLCDKTRQREGKGEFCVLWEPVFLSCNKWREASFRMINLHRKSGRDIQWFWKYLNKSMLCLRIRLQTCLFLVKHFNWRFGHVKPLWPFSLFVSPGTGMSKPWADGSRNTASEWGKKGLKAPLEHPRCSCSAPSVLWRAQVVLPKGNRHLQSSRHSNS